MELKRQTVRGVKWAGFAQTVVNGLDFIIYAILARLLFPEDLGIFAMVTVFTGLIATINQLGLNIAIIQRTDLDDSHLSAVFWIILIFAIALCLSVVGLAPLGAEYFSNKLVQPILMVLSLNFILTAFGFVHNALLQRWLEFHKIAFVEITTISVGGLSAIVMAYNGWGVWSLVWSWVGQNFVRTVCLWSVCSWRPKLTVNFQRFRELFSFGKYIVGNNVVTQIVNNVICLLIGKMLGEFTLGIYFLAYKLSQLPAQKICPVVSRVALPAFSSIQDDTATISWIYQKKITYISLASFPLLFGMLATAPRFIKTVYGYKWVDAILPLQILCVMGLIICTITTAGIILQAKGRPDILFRWNLMARTVYILVLLFSLKYKLIGVCVGLTVTTFVVYSVIQYIANSCIQLGMKDFLLTLYPATLSSLLMVVTISLYEKFYGGMFGQGSSLGFIIPVAFGGVVYLASIRFIFGGLYNEIKGLLRPAG